MTSMALRGMERRNVEGSWEVVRVAIMDEAECSQLSCSGGSAEEQHRSIPARGAVLEKKWEASSRAKEEKMLGAGLVVSGAVARIRLAAEEKVGMQAMEMAGRTREHRSLAVTVSSSSRKRKDEHE